MNPLLKNNRHRGQTDQPAGSFTKGLE